MKKSDKYLIYKLQAFHDLATSLSERFYGVSTLGLLADQCIEHNLLFKEDKIAFIYYCIGYFGGGNDKAIMDLLDEKKIKGLSDIRQERQRVLETIRKEVERNFIEKEKEEQAKLSPAIATHYKKNEGNPNHPYYYPKNEQEKQQEIDGIVKVLMEEYDRNPLKWLLKKQKDAVDELRKKIK